MWLFGALRNSALARRAVAGYCVGDMVTKEGGFFTIVLDEDQCWTCLQYFGKKDIAWAALASGSGAAPLVSENTKIKWRKYLADEDGCKCLRDAHQCYPCYDTERHEDEQLTLAERRKKNEEPEEMQKWMVKRNARARGELKGHRKKPTAERVDFSRNRYDDTFSKVVLSKLAPYIHRNYPHMQFEAIVDMVRYAMGYAEAEGGQDELRVRVWRGHAQA